MTGSHLNPLKHDALTVDTVIPGNQIITWTPDKSETVRRLTILGDAYVDGDGDLVVDVEHRDGHQTSELTSSVGLSGDRYTGEWTAIAIIDDQDEV